MGILDQVKKAAATGAGVVKDAASTVGAEAGKAGKVAQAQVKLRSLQGDLADAEKELGQAAFDLCERGDLPSTGLEAALATVREAKAAVAAKEAEIAAIKAEGADAPAADAPGESATEMPGSSTGGAD